MTRKHQWKQVAEKLKERFGNAELHHIFGRRGRLLACERFIVPLRADRHQGKGYGKLSRKLRDDYREEYREFKDVNEQNMADNECWLTSCPIHGCPLGVKSATG